MGSHFQTYSGGENDNVQTYIHYYHGGYAELLHQGNSSDRARNDALGTKTQRVIWNLEQVLSDLA